MALAGESGEKTAFYTDNNKNNLKYRRLSKNRKVVRFSEKKHGHSDNLYFCSTGYSGDFGNTGEVCIKYRLNPENNVCLIDHVVFGESVLPTDAYLEIIVSACRSYFNIDALVFQNIAIVKPLIGSVTSSTDVTLVFQKYKNGLRFVVRSDSHSSHNETVQTIHLRGILYPADKRGGRSAKLSSAMSNNDNETFLIETFYAKESSVFLGPFYRFMKELTFGPQYAIGKIEINSQNSKFVINPSVVGAALANAMSFGPSCLENNNKEGGLFLPHKIEKLVVFGPLVGDSFISLAEVKNAGEDWIDLYLEISDEKGNLVVVFETLRLQRVRKDSFNTPPTQRLQQKTERLKAKTQPPIVPTAVSKKSSDCLDIAVIGMSCCFPMSKNVDEFWDVLKNGKNCITEVPTDRWEEFDNWYHPDPDHQDTSYSKWGGFIDDVDKFDPLFFNISPSEAELMDPQQRKFLQEAWKTFESAGYAPGMLDTVKCGVFVGCTTGDYDRLLTMKGEDKTGQSFMGTSSAILAARISYFLNLKGPSFTVDTACSSSLTAIHLACNSIRAGECDMAIAGGVSVFSTPMSHILTSRVGMQSMDGRCFTFDKAANGTVFSEGCGVVLLKPLIQAEKDRDPIIGLIKASGINQDGKTNGITAPSAKSQENLIHSIYTKYNICPDEITYVEAHGTATPLGDPIEVQALTNAFQRTTKNNQYCAIGSVKSNIGHGSYAAGVAGFIKTLLCLKYRQYVPNAHFSVPNTLIDFEGSPFFVSTNHAHWPEPVCGKRMAAISSFGFSGTNAHVVLQEYKADVSGLVHLNRSTLVNQKPTVFIIPFSAKTKQCLVDLATDMSRYLKRFSSGDDLLNEGANEQRGSDVNHSGMPSLADIAYTLQVGRDSMDERVAFVVNSSTELVRKLEEYADGSVNMRDCYQGNARHSQSILSFFNGDDDVDTLLASWIRKGMVSKYLNLWVNGMSIDWTLLYKGDIPNKVMLPTYPFAKDRYWVTDGINNNNQVQLNQLASSAVIHPLVHTNDSTLQSQSYHSRFDGSEYFTAINASGQVVLVTELVFLEMARVAVSDAARDSCGAARVDLIDAKWLPETYAADENAKIYVDLHDIQFDRDNRPTSLNYTIYSIRHSAPQKVVYMQGAGVLVHESTQESTQESPHKNILESISLPQLLESMTCTTLDASQCDRYFEALNMDCIPGDLGMQALYLGKGQAIVQHHLPQILSDSSELYVLHPATMALVCNTAAAIVKGLSNVAGSELALKGNGAGNLYDDLFLMTNACSRSVEKVEILRPLTESIYTWIRYSNGTASRGNTFTMDMALCDAHGNICIRITGYNVEISLPDCTTSVDSCNNERVTLSNQTSDAFTLDVFEESWINKAAHQASGWNINTIVCLLSDKALQAEFKRAIQRVSGVTSIIFIAQGHGYKKYSNSLYEVAVTNGQCSCTQVFQDIYTNVSAVDSIINLWPLENHLTGRHTQPVLSIIESLVATGLPVKQLMLTGEISDQLDVYYFNQWNSMLQSAASRLRGVVLTTLVTRRIESETPRSISNWAVVVLNELRQNQSGYIQYSGDTRLIQLRQKRVKPALVMSPIQYGGTYLIVCESITIAAALTDYLSNSGAATLIFVGQSVLCEDFKRNLVTSTRADIEIEYIKLTSWSSSCLEDVWCQALKLNAKINGVFCLSGVNHYSATNEAVFDADQPTLMLNCAEFFSNSKFNSVNTDFICCFLSSTDRVKPHHSESTQTDARCIAQVTRLNRIEGQGQPNPRFTIIDWVGYEVCSDTFTLLVNVIGKIIESAVIYEYNGSLTIMGEVTSGSLNPSQLPGNDAPVLSHAVKIPHNEVFDSTDFERKEPSRSELQASVKRDLKNIIHALIKIDQSLLKDDVHFSEYGFDSINLTDLARRLSQHFSIEVLPAVLFGNSTLGALSAYLLTEKESSLKDFYTDTIDSLSRNLSIPTTLNAVRNKACATQVAPIKEARLPAPAIHPSSKPDSARIAVIGMSGKLPMADDLDMFWDNLKSGKDCVTGATDEFWDLRGGGAARDGNDSDKNIRHSENVTWGGFIDGIAEFDPQIFGISDREAQLMDPQQRLMMMYAYRAIEDSGYSPRSLAGKNIAVFIGTANSGYDRIIEKSGEVTDAFTATGTQPSVGPNRISYFLDLCGPSEPIETACASSLVAIRRGVAALKEGCEMAIVGGVNTLLSPQGHTAYAKAGMLSPNGHCKSFSANADGFVRSEGVGMLVLKPLSNAEMDGDNIYGVICGSAESHGGRSHSLTTPNPVAQMQLLTKAYKEAGIDPRTVTYIEAHGTGTQLGDSIEMEGLKSAFASFSVEPEPGIAAMQVGAGSTNHGSSNTLCGVGSVKTNIGHTELASGVIGVIKVLLQLKHATLVKNLNTSPRNPYLQLDGSPFYIVDNEQKWASLTDDNGLPIPRRAGVSAIGMGGVNAHVIIEEYTARRETSRASASEQLIVFSAKTDEQLERVVKQMLDYVVKQEDIHLPSVAYTLQLGRDQLDVRLAMIVSDREALISGMKRFLKIEHSMDCIVRIINQDKPTQGAELTDKAVHELIQENKLEELGQYWLQGNKVPWALLHQQSKVRRISLPTYPFDKKCYWVTESAHTVDDSIADTAISYASIVENQPVNSGDALIRSPLYNSWMYGD